MESVVKRTPLNALLLKIPLLCFVLTAVLPVLAQDVKPVPDMHFSYRISNGVKHISVKVSQREGNELRPVSNTIVNLSLRLRRKYNPLRGEGWMGNTMTNSEGLAEFTLTPQFYQLNGKEHEFDFIANIGTDPVFRDTETRIHISEPQISVEFAPGQNAQLLNIHFDRQVNKSLESFAGAVFDLLLTDSTGKTRFSEKALRCDNSGDLNITLQDSWRKNLQSGDKLVLRYTDPENDGYTERVISVPESMLASSYLAAVFSTQAAIYTGLILVAIVIVYTLLFGKAQTKTN
ncbi:MAG TPA: hypothetical protein PLQ93_04745 [Bacteroidia bacterium]|nr:hypothetical protein [Bacteroidia bacterium]